MTARVDKKVLVEAINYMILAPNYVALSREITRIIENWDSHPMAYSGELKHLNALIDIGLESRDAFEKIIGLIEERRKLVPEIKRVDYQRNLMRERRARLNKAAMLQELQTGRTLTAEQKKDLAKTIQARWMKARERYIEEAGAATWAERNAATNRFWEEVDAKLDLNIHTEQEKRLRK
jgi:hypothetical protein